MKCPCGTEKNYIDCCEPFVVGKAHAPTPEALMRSRYTAYTKAAIGYLRETLAPESRADFQEKEVLDWAKQSIWLGLKILKAQGNEVEFVARYKAQGKTIEHHEKSEFRKDNDRWYFVDGKPEVQEVPAETLAPMVREAPKIGRNDPCSCGSGKKYKKCCGVAA